MLFFPDKNIKFGFLMGQDIRDEKVLKHLDRIGYTYRFVEVDGEPCIITADMNFERLDLSIRNNKIIDF